MEMTVTQFRHKMFEMINLAAAGTEVSVTHKGRHFRIVPEDKPTKMSRMTRLDVLNPDVPESAEAAMRDEMRQAWERDWKEL